MKIALVNALCNVADEIVLVSPSDLNYSKIIMVVPLFVNVLVVRPQAVGFMCKQ
jgi:hypothetical protein